MFKHRKTIFRILVIICILSLIPLVIELFTILTSEYIMICSKEDKEYIQTISHTNYDFKIAILDVEGFMNPYSNAKIIINNVLPYPTIIGEKKIIENNSDNIKNIVSSYIETHSNKLLVLGVCVVPYIILYTVTYIYIKSIKYNKSKNA